MAPAIATAPMRPSNPSTGISGWKQRASQFFCLLMLLGFPIFSVPCQKGSCSSPLEVITTYAYVKGVVPDDWMRVVLYPASMMLKMEVLMGDEPQSFQLPEWDGILKSWNLTEELVENDSAGQPVQFSFVPNLLSMFDVHNPNSLSWEFVGACAVCLLGAFLSVLGPNKISFGGIVLVLWFIFIEGGRRTDVSALPMFALAVICSLGWVNFKELFSFPTEDKPKDDDVKPKVEFKKKE